MIRGAIERSGDVFIPVLDSPSGWECRLKPEKSVDAARKAILKSGVEVDKIEKFNG